MRTLVLNSGYEPLHLVSWQKALCLVLIGKADIVSEHNEVVRTVTKQFRRPSIVKLKKYIRFAARLGFVRCTRKNILLRDEFVCQYCSVKCNHKTATVDHVIPRAKGGQTVWDNVVAACAKCNRKKGCQDLSATSMNLIRKPKRPSWSDMVRGSREPIHKDWLPFLSHYK